MWKLSCALVSSAVVAFVALNTSVEARRHRRPNFDGFVFAQQWLPSVCRNPKTRTCTVNPNEVSKTSWTIHGLWPSDLNQDGLEQTSYCNDVCGSECKLTSFKLRAFEDELERVWPSSSGSNFGFWRHEWSKHGTCGMTHEAISGQSDYFRRAINLATKDYNLYKILDRAGMRPGGTYSIKEYQDALATEGVPANAIMFKYFCERKKGCFVEEIRLCLDRKFNPTSCNRKGYNQRTRLTYPEEL